jgi:hypothetical protein
MSHNAFDSKYVFLILNLFKKVNQFMNLNMNFVKTDTEYYDCKEFGLKSI